MGATYTSIHVFNASSITIDGFTFRSFSEGWQSCITDLSEKDTEYAYKSAVLISKQCPFPILYFSVFDSEALELCLLQNGKFISYYVDGEAPKRLYSIPSILGYPDGYKKRLSHILACDNTEYKIQLLEEYFGLCLLPFSICPKEILVRKQDDALYRDYVEKEKALSGKNAPVSVQLKVEYKGKLFWDYFGSHTQKEHCYLFGYTDPKADLSSVQFTNGSLEPITKEEFAKNRKNQTGFASCFKVDYENPHNTVTFLQGCPSTYIGKTLTLPTDFYPLGFGLDSYLILYSRSRIYVMNDEMQIIAKISVKGEITDLADDCILTTVGDSFCGYEYDPKATVRIYQLIRKSY